MERVLIRDLNKHVGETVTVCGWIAVRRDQGKMVFIDLRDRSGTVQGVVLPKSDAIQTAKEVTVQSAVEIGATVTKRPEKNILADKENGDIELHIDTLMIIGAAQTLPFELSADLNLDTYLDYLPLTLRTERARDIFKLQETIIDEFRLSLREQDFAEFQSPTLVGADAEGGAAAFEVGYYYDKKAFLATSPQFYKQIMVGPFERVFATQKVFRGEKHSTARHLSEYSSMDFEMGFIQDHTDVMRALEVFVSRLVRAVSTKHKDMFARFAVELPMLPTTIPSLKLRDAQKILGTLEEPDLEPEQERAICEWAKKEHDSDFIFITHYPVKKRPFYTYEDENDPGYTKSFDLLFRGLEITTGGQRIHTYDTLLERIKDRGLKPDQFSFYLQAFKYGMPPHGGSATGLERFTARMLGLSNIKEATLFPRDLNRIDMRLSE